MHLIIVIQVVISYNKCMKNIIEKYPKTKFIAHRGQPSVVLENTKESFLVAAQLPFYGIETDVHLTKDHIPVIHHDDNLLRLASKDALIKDSTFKFLSHVKLKNQYLIPHLNDYLTICKDYHKQAILELKSVFSHQEIDIILDNINAHNYMDRVTIISFHLSNITYVRSKYKTLEIHYLADYFDESLLKTAIQYQFNLSLNYPTVSKKIVDYIHKNQLKINVWTVNSLDLIEKYVQMGVDYITTDGI